MTKRTVGPWGAAQKLPSPALARDRQTFLTRTRRDAQRGRVPLIGLGGTCGKPCFALPYTVTWREEHTLVLEDVAAAFECFVEYGASPHLKRNDDGQEVAAVQDWSPFATLYLRPGYEGAEELLAQLGEVLGTLQPA